MGTGPFKNTISVCKGVDAFPAVNPHAVEQFKNKRGKKLSVAEYVDGIRSGNRIVLSQAITIIESSLAKHQTLAKEIITQCLPYSGNSKRIGITGVPGVGKSTFIETLGKYITLQGHNLAVLTIDPSSERSKGSILGDKTRMEELSVDPRAFIRPSPSAGSLGGVARKTRETIILCEAAGFDTIFIETVGVGQSETAVHSMVDFFLLLMLAGAGDELQGIKRGIMEMADTIAITKADQANILKAEQAKMQYQNAIHLFQPSESKWVPQVITCSAINHIGTDVIWNIIEEYFKVTHDNGTFLQKRRTQSKYWFHETIDEILNNHFYNHPFIKTNIEDYEEKVLQGNMTSYEAAFSLINKYFSK